MLQRAYYLGFSLLLIHCGVGKVFTGLGGAGKNGAQNGAGEGEGTGNGDASGTSTTSTTPTPAPVISPDAPGCARGQIAPAKVAPLHFVFTLDRSGSMNDTAEADAANRPTKWESLQAAMTAVFEDLGKAADRGDDSVAVGVNYFSEATNNDSGPETKVELPLEPLTRARANTLKTDINGRNARGYTPTETALNLSYDALSAYKPTGALENGTKVLILVSDGKPNPPTATPAVIPDLVASKKSGTPPVKTFSIGIGELGTAGDDHGYEPGLMSKIADRGGTGKAGCDPNNTSDPAKFCHFQITPSQSTNITTDLINAFNAIRDQVQSCELPLKIENKDALEPRAVIVVAEKDNAPQRILPHDAQNGWTFDNDSAPTNIELHGAECDRLRTKDTQRVFAILGCACDLDTSNGSGSTNGNGQEGPARQESGPGAVAGDWNTDWCSYDYVVIPPGACVGEGCPQ